MQQRPLATRKRSAPGAAPATQQPQQQFNSNLSFQQAHDPPSTFDNNSYGNWDGLNNIAPQYPAPSVYDTDIYDTGLKGSMGPDSGGRLIPVQPSSQLVRRNPNQSLVSRDQPAWPDTGGGAAHGGEGWPQAEDEGDLEQRAIAAKHEAMTKRKQIPPFVQKLSSFLDDNTNTELIRWSEKGDSFVVLDEDEFAKTLIPELFKHNNYASFVRQLNMYGFHKRVGLSDNSMKASENKRKAPSEYYNKYFRRGRPELLWLIQKPKNPPSAKRKRDDDKSGGHGDSDDDRRYTPAPDGPGPISGEGVGMTKDVAALPKAELATVRQEIQNLQVQQQRISQMMQAMKARNDQFYRQANAFQDMHNRHENSINAILTFLATFYNRSLEGQSQGNFPDIFAGAIPQNANPQQGNIVDMGDFPEVEMDMPRPNQQLQRRPRQPLLLLGPGVKSDAPSPNSPVTIPSSSRSTVSPKGRSQSIFRPPNSSGTPGTSGPPTSPAIKTDAETPNMVNDNQGMMSVINAANSASPPTSGAGLDFDAALQHFQTAEGNTPLTPEQRNEMLTLMQSTMNGANSNTGNDNTTLNGSQAPTMPIGMPASQEDMDTLQRLQEQQAARVQELADRLQPLSPSGTIPGLSYDFNENGDAPNAPPSDFNLEDWANMDHDYFPDTSNYDDEGLGNMEFPYLDDATNTGIDGGASTDLNGLNDNFVNEQNLSSGGRVKSLSSRGASPVDSAKAEENDDASMKKRRKMRSA